MQPIFSVQQARASSLYVAVIPRYSRKIVEKKRYAITQDAEIERLVFKIIGRATHDLLLIILGTAGLARASSFFKLQTQARPAPMLVV